MVARFHPPHRTSVGFMLVFCEQNQTFEQHNAVKVAVHSIRWFRSTLCGFVVFRPVLYAVSSQVFL